MISGASTMATKFTRQEFYDLVWSSPLSQLSKRFGLSDVALHKICRKHDVPHPPLGWWAKKAAGKEVAQTPLPEQKTEIAAIITIIGGEYSKEPASLRAVREQARVIASSASDGGSVALHPIVEKSMTALKKAKPSESGLLVTGSSGLISCQVASESLERLPDILNTVVAAAERQGFTLVKSDQAACFNGAGETISFSVTERVRRIKHELTEAEKAAEEKWQRKLERDRFRNSWGDWASRPTFPEWDYRCTGELSLEIEHVYVATGQSPRRSFRDAKIQRLENMADEIAVGLAVTAAAKTERRLWQEDCKRREEEERKRREAVQRQKHIHERRTGALAGILDEVDQIERLRRLIAALDSELNVGVHDRVDEFLQWAKQHLEQMKAALTLDALDQRFGAEHLFGGDDDYRYYPSFR